MEDGQHLLGLITDVEELLLILNNFYGNQSPWFPISLKSRGFCSLFMSSGKSNAKSNPLASFFSREEGKIKASPLQGYPLVTSFLTFMVAKAATTSFGASVTRSLLLRRNMTNPGT